MIPDLILRSDTVCRFEGQNGPNAAKVDREETPVTIERISDSQRGQTVFLTFQACSSGGPVLPFFSAAIAAVILSQVFLRPRFCLDSHCYPEAKFGVLSASGRLGRHRDLGRLSACALVLSFPDQVRRLAHLGGVGRHSPGASQSPSPINATPIAAIPPRNVTRETSATESVAATMNAT